MNHIKLVFDGTGVMIGLMVAQRGVDHVLADGFEPWHRWEFACGSPHKM